MVIPRIEPLYPGWSKGFHVLCDLLADSAATYVEETCTDLACVVT